MRTRVLRGDAERGSAVIEAVIAVPAFMLFVLLIIFAGRLAVAGQAVEAAASEAARAASISRTRQQADSDATAGAAASLRNQGLRCVAQQVAVDTTGFATPVGTPATVSATVTCLVDLSDLAIPGPAGHPDRHGDHVVADRHLPGTVRNRDEQHVE